MAGGKVAFQGALGAYSHEACVALRPWDEPVPYPTFDEAVQAVVRGECACAMIPVEHNVGGPIAEAQAAVDGSGLKLAAEAWRPIRFTLMGLPSARLGAVKTAESHPVVLQQCARSLAELGIRPVEAFDTAGAAEAVAESADSTRAALAPALAAELYGLSVLRHDMQDSADNQLRFVVLEKAG